MRTSVTFRLDTEQRKKLRDKSRLLGKTESQFVRDLLNRELDERPLGQALAGLKGTISLAGKPREGWRREIQSRNWRP